MNFEKFLALNRNKILGYTLIAWLSGKSENLEAPFPPEDISEDHEEELKSALNQCMPLYNMMIDLWDWDIHFERELSNDWYFYSLFGDDSDVFLCAKELSEFFIEKCDEYLIDYDQWQNDEFENLVNEEAAKFIYGWRKNVFDRYGRALFNLI